MAISAQHGASAATLMDCPISDIIVHVQDPAASRAYYEGLLGLPVEHSDRGAVALACGPLRLWLLDAGQAGVELTGEPNDCSDLVFLTEDGAALRDALQQRGVQPAHQRTYEVGTVVDFYDPDGHRLMLYEPSQHAMETEVAPQIRQIWRDSGRGERGLIGPAREPLNRGLVETGLDGKPIVYMFFFLDDMVAAGEFFAEQLGLRVLQLSHCCSDSCPDGAPGVVKYDGGPVILSSHHIHGHDTVLDDSGKPYAARQTDPRFCKGLAAAFRVQALSSAKAALAERGARFREGIVALPGAGKLAAFEAPSGHLFYLHERDS